MNGIESIAEERQRQIEIEDWTPEHDDTHTDSSLAMVAALYAAPEPLYIMCIEEKTVLLTDPWPESWHDDWDRRDDFDTRLKLVIAGALIAAEIDRLDRIDAKKGRKEFAA